MELILIIIELLMIDLIMGGDNAIIIAMATKDLESNIKFKASIIGALFAILLRVIFVFVLIAIGSMKIPLLNVICGGLLVYIAISLVRNDEPTLDVGGNKSLKKAIFTIIIADLVMSVDNVVALSVVAMSAPVPVYGKAVLVLVALLVSFPIILFGASILSKLIDKYFFIVYIFGFMMMHVAIDLMLKDNIFHGLEAYLENHNLVFPFTWGVALILILITIYVTNKNKEKKV